MNNISRVKIIILLLVSGTAFAQKNPAQIEINPYMRLDKYPEFFYSINSTTNSVNIKGSSWGINANYKLPVQKNLYLKAGLGYYRYSFDRINKENSLFGKSNARNIIFPSPLYILFYTDKYWYNTVSLNIGIEKVFEFKKLLQIITGLNINNYYTYSQSYHITYNNQDNPITNPYKRKEGRFFGLSGNLTVGVLKKYNKYNLGPTFILPVYDVWKTDNTFDGENNSGTRSKWLKGIGFGISFNYLLTKKTKLL